jgi:four helix bundle protein
MHNFKQLKVWQQAIEIACEIYKTTAAFPSEEKFGLTAQMRRCAVSFSSTIEEGAGRNSNKKLCHFLSTFLKHQVLNFKHKFLLQISSVL